MSRHPAHRLAPDVRPTRVRVHVDVNPDRRSTFRGEVAIDLRLSKSRNRIRLHASELRVTRPRIEIAGRSLRGRIALLPKVEMVEVAFDEKLPPGDATLRLAFSGKLRTDLSGLYAAKVGQRRYAFTQLEATDARKFFPCFDEPAMKARFEVSVTTGITNTALGNAPVTRTERGARGPGVGLKTIHFAETPPLSTYLVALAVGKLDSSKTTHLGPTEIRIWHTPGKGRMTAFGLEAARETLRRLERYFGIPYPYAKLDLVAVPDFEFGAMENAGAVFFRETLLLIDAATATLTEKKRAAEVICHELAHMWFGDLVTMAWWDDLWLNEAFATWMAFQIVDDWKPEWKMWQDFQHGRAAALELDALRHTHPVYCEVKTPAEASENFDVITYEKGASVVRMIERYLGPSSFRKGVRAYIREHREGNAVASDLWRALSEASGEDVETVARAWIEQEGYPVVSVRHERARGRSQLVLKQERFAEQPLPKTKRAGQKRRAKHWPIPWVGRVGTGITRSRTVRHLCASPEERVPLGGAGPRFIYGNADESGFFRPQHARDDHGVLLDHLAALSPVERMGLADHQWALVRAGRAPLGSILDLAAALSDDAEADVLAVLRKPLAFIGRSLLPNAAPSCEVGYRQFLVEHFGPPLERLGFKAATRQDDATRLRRAALMDVVGGLAASPAVVERAEQACDRYLENRRSIDADLADAVVSLAASAGGGARHRQFVKAMSNSTTPQEERRFLLALGDFRRPALINRTLSLTLTDEVATQDVIFLLARLFSNPAARVPTWDFIVKHWPKLRRRMPSLLASRLISATPSLLTPRYRSEVAHFFRNNPVESGNRALRQALERFDWYKTFRRSAGPALRRRFD